MMRGRLLILLSIGILTCVFGTWVVRALPGVERLELLAYDTHERALPPLAADPRIVIVGMDDESLSHLPLERPAYPLPRTFHAHVLHELTKAGAKVVGFDMVFSRSIPAEDKVLADAMRMHGNVLCGLNPQSVITRGDETFRFTEPAIDLRPSVRPCSLNVSPVYGRVRWITPFVTDSATGKQYIHMTLGLASAYTGSVIQRVADLPIRFAGPAGTFQPVPYYEVYTGAWRQKRGDHFFRDKIVLIGAAQPFIDHHVTPLGDMLGVEILAQTTQMLLAANSIEHSSEQANFLFRLALVSIFAVAVWRLGIRRAAFVGAIEAVVWVLVTRELFVARGVWVDTVEPIGTLTLSLILTTSYEATRIRHVFQRFMPSWIAEQMLESSPNARALTAEKDVTIVFCDVRDSTRLEDVLPLSTVDQLLRKYFVAGEEAAVRLGTELDKFVGDEMMLFFEDRPGHEDHPIRAVRWTLAMQKAAREITESGLAGEIGFRVGIGVCSGRARVGFVGAKQRIQHTVVGDPVNTASRLQTATKEVDREIVIAEVTWERVKHKFEGEDLGEIIVKGKQNPIRVYYPTHSLN